jgi:hypothetical protein
MSAAVAVASIALWISLVAAILQTGIVYHHPAHPCIAMESIVRLEQSYQILYTTCPQWPAVHARAS